MSIYKVSFESTTGYTQIANDGYDINCVSGGAFDSLGLYGCRSESLRVIRTGNGIKADVRGLNHQPGAINPAWFAGAWALNQIVKGTAADGKQRAYRVTTAGTSAGSEPIWPTSGTVSDGSVVWTYLSYNVVDIGDGEFNFRTSNLDPTATFRAPRSTDLASVEINANYTVQDRDQFILASPLTADVAITLNGDGAIQGRTVTVKRGSTAAHNVTINGVYGGNGFNGGAITLPSGTLDSVTVIGSGGGFAAAGWYMLQYTASTTH